MYTINPLVIITGKGDNPIYIYTYVYSTHIYIYTTHICTTYLYENQFFTIYQLPTFLGSIDQGTASIFGASQRWSCAALAHISDWSRSLGDPSLKISCLIKDDHYQIFTYDMCGCGLPVGLTQIWKNREGLKPPKNIHKDGIYKLFEDWGSSNQSKLVMLFNCLAVRFPRENNHPCSIGNTPSFIEWFILPSTCVCLPVSRNVNFPNPVASMF